VVPAGKLRVHELEAPPYSHEFAPPPWDTFIISTNPYPLLGKLIVSV
jgi:hypothetical protein